MSTTTTDILDALRAAMTQPALYGGTDGYTGPELQAILKIGKVGLRNVLAPLCASGQVEVVRVARQDRVGRHTSTWGYRFTAKKK